MTDMSDFAAEAAIAKLQMRYCRAVDRTDFALLRDCFHGDASLHYGFFEGGLDDFVAMAEANLAGYRGTSHFTGNQLVEVDGDAAWAEHYTSASHRLAADDDGPERDLVTMVRYVDRVERRAGAWRIARRTCILDFWRSDPVAPAGDGPQQVERGRRDRADASYRR